MNKDKVAILDSSGIIALIKPDDSLHSDALAVIKIIESGGWQILLPYEVLNEALNIIGKMLGRKDAIKVGNSLLEQYNSNTVTFINSKAHVISKAISKLEAATGSPSFTDSLVMAFADEQNTPYIFGFDATFQKTAISCRPKVIFC